MKKPKIKIETVPNGYTLDIDGNGYMYSNVQDLLAGILAHLGMGEKEPMMNKEILEVLFDAILGSDYAKKVKTMRSDIMKLEGEYREKLERLNKTFSRIREYERMTDSLEGDLGKVRVDIRRTENEYKEGKTLANELLKGVESLQSKIIILKEELKESRALIRELHNIQKSEAKKAEEEKAAAEPKPKGRPKKITPQDRAAAYEKKKRK